MSFCFGSQIGSQGKTGRKTEIYMSAFVPLLVLVGGSGFHSGSEGFSELDALPQAQVSAIAETPQETPSVAIVANPENPALVSCRWQADRELLSNLGRSVSEKTRSDCSEYQQHAETGSPVTGKKVIREKVVALASAEYPIVDMADSIARYDDPIAGLIVGIAKKESNWGKRTPKLKGEECFNYWGYRGPGNRGMTEDGYGCFEKPSDAVETIGNRLVELSELRQTTEPANMVIWKCGSSCAAHSPESVRKWISDVDIYYQQFAKQ